MNESPSVQTTTGLRSLFRVFRSQSLSLLLVVVVVVLLFFFLFLGVCIFLLSFLLHFSFPPLSLSLSLIRSTTNKTQCVYRETIKTRVNKLTLNILFSFFAVTGQTVVEVFVLSCVLVAAVFGNSMVSQTEMI